MDRNLFCWLKPAGLILGPVPLDTSQLRSLPFWVLLFSSVFWTSAKEKSDRPAEMLLVCLLELHLVKRENSYTSLTISLGALAVPDNHNHQALLQQTLHSSVCTLGTWLGQGLGVGKLLMCSVPKTWNYSSYVRSFLSWWTSQALSKTKR